MELTSDEPVSPLTGLHGPGWGWRSLFCRTRDNVSPRQVTPASQRADEELRLESAGHPPGRGHEEAGARPRPLNDVRVQHFTFTEGDPTAGAGRLRTATDGLWKKDGVPERKQSAAPRMMLGTRKGLRPAGSKEGATRWAAVAAGCFFLPRGEQGPARGGRHARVGM